jgi:hypothetical protein
VAQIAEGLRRIFEKRHLSVKPGCGWLKGDRLFEDGVRHGLRRQVQAQSGA